MHARHLSLVVAVTLGCVSPTLAPNHTPADAGVVTSDAHVVGAVDGGASDAFVPREAVAVYEPIPTHSVSWSTSQVHVSLHIDTRTPLSLPLVPFDPESPVGAFATNAGVTDSAARRHELTIYFDRSSEDAWTWNAVVDGGDVAGGLPGFPVIAAAGTATCVDGRLHEEDATEAWIDFTEAYPGQHVTFWMGPAANDPAGWPASTCGPTPAALYAIR